MKSDDMRLHWNKKYEDGLPSLEEADPFFLSAYDQFVDKHFHTGGSALDLAGGLGRHALWLAERNWEVSVVDISEVAIQHLDEKARRLGMRMILCVCDVADYQFEPDRFDLIVVYYHFDRNVCASLIEALRPGGFVICKSSVSWQPYEGNAPAKTRPLARGEILDRLLGLRVLHHVERSVRDRGVVEYVGQRI